MMMMMMMMTTTTTMMMMMMINLMMMAIVINKLVLIDHVNASDAINACSERCACRRCEDELVTRPTLASEETVSDSPAEQNL